MHVTHATDRPLLQPCSLDGYDVQIDTYVGCEHLCHYCYALNAAESDWGEEILVHRALRSRLQAELDRYLSVAVAPSAVADAAGPQAAAVAAAQGPATRAVYLGWNCDPYQPVEAKARQTRAALEVLTDRGWSATVLTKSPLVTRDIDLFRRMPDASLGVSVAFRDEPVRRRFEARAPATSRRVAALRELHEAGLDTYALICPVMPYLTPVRELIEDLRPYVATIWVYALAMSSEDDPNWRNVQAILREHFPDLEARYREIAFDPGHAFWIELREDLERLQRERPDLDIRLEMTF